MPRRPFPLPLILAAAILAMPCAIRAAEAAMYTWTDKNGEVHITDRAPADPSAKPVDQKDAQGLVVSRSAGRDKEVLALIEGARRHPRFAELQALAREYKSSHTYSMADWFVCIDMALEMHNLLKTKGFSPMVLAGNPKVDLSLLSNRERIRSMNHAWVVVDLGKGALAAVETTAGFIVDEHTPHFEDYYQGLVFDSPRQAKDVCTLLQNINQSCKDASTSVRDWNSANAGKKATPQIMESKGEAKAKADECLGNLNRYEAIIARQFKLL